MKSFVAKNSLKIFVGSLFIVGLAIAVGIYRYANRTPVIDTPREVVASDTVPGDITVQKADSIRFR